MNPKISNCIVLVCVCLWLVGCGGGGGGGGGSAGRTTSSGGGGGTTADPRLAVLDGYETQKLRVLGDPSGGVSAMVLTPADQIPLTGTATFAGSTSVRVELQNDPLVLYGDATLDMTFGSGGISGTLGNFFGGTQQGGVADYQGEITVTGGSPVQEMAIDYAGSLTATGRTLVFNGTLAVLFLGTPVAAIAASDLEAVVDHNGTSETATVIVIGEGSVIPPPDVPP